MQAYPGRSSLPSGVDRSGTLTECLNEHWFLSLAEAQQVIEAWRVDYNTVRPIARSAN